MHHASAYGLVGSMKGKGGAAALLGDGGGVWHRQVKGWGSGGGVCVVHREWGGGGGWGVGPKFWCGGCSPWYSTGDVGVGEKGKQQG